MRSMNGAAFWRVLLWVGSESTCGDIWSPFRTQALHLPTCISGRAVAKQKKNKKKGEEGRGKRHGA